MNDIKNNKPPCILVVDDDHLTRAIVESGVRKAGYAFLQAENAADAIHLIASETPDLAVLDISMPQMSGIELARHLRAAAIPFMFLTTHSEDEMVTQAIEEGAVGYLVKPVDITQIMPAIRAGLIRSAEIKRLQAEQAELHASLNQVQDQLIQTDKMAAIGQLAAGVAHEINNPIGYVHSNIGTLGKYVNELFSLLDALVSESQAGDAHWRAELERLQKEYDLPFLREDIPALLGESMEGISRVRQIVQDLKDFSHTDNAAEWQAVDLRKGLESTLNIVHNEIKYKGEVVREYGEIPDVECVPGQINQVFMNLLVNAAHALSVRAEDHSGRIVVRTGSEGDHVWVEIADNGCGIAPENLKRIFAPFFTTKPVGQGTGLGLSLSYGIVKKHEGSIEVESKEGQGTMFRVTLPRQRSR